jgi:F0F1-type ATP synthase assembly protein I
MAIELPIVLIGSIAIGGWLGYLMDHWLHKDSIFTLIFGGLGFAAGIFEVLRRLSGEEKREEKDRDRTDDG